MSKIKKLVKESLFILSENISDEALDIYNHVKYDLAGSQINKGILQFSFIDAEFRNKELFVFGTVLYRDIECDLLFRFDLQGKFLGLDFGCSDEVKQALNITYFDILVGDILKKIKDIKVFS